MGIDALKTLGSQSFYLFLASSFLISIPLAACYNFTQTFLGNTEFQEVAAVQTIGQTSEVVFMLLMPLFFIRMGVKWMLGVGMFAWVLRYALFAMGAPDAVTWLIISGIALHGICYDFFFVTGQIYVDKKARDEVCGQAQGLIILITYGAGMLVGAMFHGWLYNSFLGGAASVVEAAGDLTVTQLVNAVIVGTGEGQLTLTQWVNFWWVPAVFAGIVMRFFVFFFHNEVEVTDQSIASVMGAEVDEKEEPV